MQSNQPTTTDTAPTWQSWKTNHPTWATQFQTRDSERYQRLVVSTTMQQVEHKYAFTIDNETGDLYLDCRRRKLFTKMLVLSIVRPIHLTVRGICHLLRGLVQPTTLGTEFKEVGRGIHRGGQMCGLQVMATFHALYDPSALYDYRRRIGAAERKLTRDNRGAMWSLSPCMSPLKNLMTMDQPQRDLELDLSALAATQIWFRQHHNAIFNDCGFKLSKTTPYVSAAIAKNTISPNFTTRSSPNLTIDSQ